nr:MAG TPA: hypothetical protein [Caudoviricetes sp.]
MNFAVGYIKDIFGRYENVSEGNLVYQRILNLKRRMENVHKRRT